MKPRTVMARSLFVAVLSIVQASAQATHYVANLGDCAALVPCHATIMDAVDAAVPASGLFQGEPKGVRV